MQWARPDSYTLVRTKSAHLKVWWAGGALPPDVLVGKMVNVVGRVITYDGGRDWRISDALPIPGSWKGILGPMFDYLAHFVADPAGWCSPEVLKMYREGRRPRTS